MDNDKLIDVLYSITDVLDRLNTEISSEWVDFSNSIKAINDAVGEIKNECDRNKEILSQSDAHKWRDLNNR